MEPIAEQRGLLLEKELNRMTEILISKYDVEKLILFGSVAQGDIHPWSDLDLVVIKDTSLPFLARIDEALRLLRPKVGLDLLIYTPDEMESLIAERRPFVLDEIIYKGAVAYERR